MSSWKNKLLSMVVHNIFLSPNSTITPLQLNTGHFHLDFKFIKHRHNNHHPSTPYAGHQSVNPFLVTKLTSIICERAHNLSNHNITTCQAKKKNSSKFITTITAKNNTWPPNIPNLYNYKAQAIIKTLVELKQTVNH